MAWRQGKLDGSGGRRLGRQGGAPERLAARRRRKQEPASRLLLLEGGGGGAGLHAVEKARPRSAGSATSVRRRESIRERQQILSLHFPFATQSSNFKDIRHKLSPTNFVSNIIGSTYDVSCIF
jgi:hypothetical protein